MDKIEVDLVRKRRRTKQPVAQERFCSHSNAKRDDWIDICSEQSHSEHVATIDDVFALNQVGMPTHAESTPPDKSNQSSAGGSYEPSTLTVSSISSERSSVDTNHHASASLMCIDPLLLTKSAIFSRPILQSSVHPEEDCDKH